MSYQDDNLFAKILRGELSAHTLYEDEMSLAFLDIAPQAPGHVLVIPKYPAVELTDLPTEYIHAVFATAKRVIHAQRAVYGQDVVQMQLNGEGAGQSVFHYHIHLIPCHVRNLGAHGSETADNADLTQHARALKDALS